MQHAAGAAIIVPVLPNADVVKRRAQHAVPLPQNGENHRPK